MRILLHEPFRTTICSADARALPAFEARRSLASRRCPSSSRSMSRSGFLSSRWSVFRTPAFGKAGIGFERPSAIPVSNFPGIESPSTWRPPTFVRRRVLRPPYRAWRACRERRDRTAPCRRSRPARRAVARRNDSADSRVLPVAVAARREGKVAILLPRANAPEASVVEGLKVLAVDSLVEAVEALNSGAGCRTRLARGPARRRLL